jgi:hypothetical protein
MTITEALNACRPTDCGWRSAVAVSPDETVYVVDQRTDGDTCYHRFLDGGRMIEVLGKRECQAATAGLSWKPMRLPEE